MKKGFSEYGKQLIIMIMLTIALIMTVAAMQKYRNGKKIADTADTGISDSGEINISDTALKLNTVITISIYAGVSETQAKELISGAFGLCDRYESLLSATVPGSDVSNINSANKNVKINVSSETMNILSIGLKYCKISNGKYDIAIWPLSSLWDFTSGDSTMEGVIPDANKIKDALKNVDYNLISIDEINDTVTKKTDEAGIDLGSIAKGYIADRLGEYLKENGATSAIIDLGGNVLALGSKPDGSDFCIGIKKPFSQTGEIALSVKLSDASVVTSGTYERYFKKDGKIYHHILNPLTGYPYDNNLLSVTIISPLSVDGDALSTTCFALGEDKGMEYIDTLDNIYAIFITDDYVLHYSDGLREKYDITEY